MNPHNRTLLALDTSTAALAVAVVRGQEVLAEVQSLAERNHSVYIVPQIQAMLQQAGVEGTRLDGIAVGHGPGSYTGMRIAVTAAKTLSWVWNVPVVSLSSLEGLAYGQWQEQLSSNNEKAANEETQSLDWYIPLLDARRGQVYAAAFCVLPDGAWLRHAPDAVRMMKDWVLELPTMMKESGKAVGKVVFTGDLTLHEEAARQLEAACSEVLYAPHLIQGRSIARLGQLRLDRGETDEAFGLLPNYTQLAEAEVKLLAKTQEG